jgi:hypothetical protein
MAKRPKISDELHEEVLSIYRASQGETPSSFEEALKLVLEYADAELSKPGQADQGWYPGKYLGDALDHLASARLAGSNRQPNRRTGSGRDRQARFKTILQEPSRIEIPAAEVRANGFQEGQLLQVIAYPLPESGERGESSAESY